MSDDFEGRGRDLGLYMALKVGKLEYTSKCCTHLGHMAWRLYLVGMHFASPPKIEYNESIGSHSSKNPPSLPSSVSCEMFFFADSFSFPDLF